MDVLGSTDQVQLNLFRTQLDEERQTRALASGLRVISASDDPSGLAVAENIQTQVLGLQQGVQNVQTASNLLNVADSTLANVQTILSRIHSLIVEAASDLNSTEQLQSIQTEIDSLLQEVNKIASSASFNGIRLLDGSLAQTTYPAAYVIQQTSSPSLPDGSTPTGAQVTNYDGVSGTPGNLIWDPASSNPATAPTLSITNSVSSYFSISVTGYSSNAIDPDSQTAIGPGDYVQLIAYSTDPRMGVAPIYMDAQAVAVGSGPIGNVQLDTPDGTATNIVNFTLANLTAADVGTSMTFITQVTSNTSSPTGGTPLTVNYGGTEGANLQISLPSVDTTTLNVSNISVLASETENYLDQSTGMSSNQVPVADAEARVQLALDSISEARATVGAQTVSLQYEANDASIQIVNQVASESAIRDVNVGAAVTQFTKDQVLSEIGTSVLAQMQSNAQLVIQLVKGLNKGVNGKV
ncbi:MAG TPA: flagellin [Candidatus Baltobacteraceae bacterium]